MKLKIKYWKLSALKPLKRNANKMSQSEFEHLKLSLKNFEAVEPLIVNINPKRKGNLVGGEHRMKAAKELGWKEFPCVERNLTAKQESELALRLNVNRGNPDPDVLKLFEQAELLTVGFNLTQLDKIFSEVQQDEKASGLPKWSCNRMRVTTT